MKKISKKDLEIIESKVFDKEVSAEFEKTGEKELVISEAVYKKHLNLSSPPDIAYRYALYLLKDSEIQKEPVLNIACGSGYESIILAKKGAYVFAFDISPKSVDMAQKRASLNNLTEKIHSEVMSVYNLNFCDCRFNYIYGNACLHHFELEKAIKEIHRVLKPGGKAIFCEPFGASKVFQAIRDLIPVKKNKVSPFERQLTREDIKVISNFFSLISVKEFGLFNRINRLIKNNNFISLINKIDAFLMENFSFLRKYARSIVIQVTK